MLYKCIPMFVCEDPSHPYTTGYRPTIKELSEAKSLCNDNTFVHLSWSDCHGYAGRKECWVTKDSDIEKMAEKIRTAIYGV